MKIQQPLSKQTLMKSNAQLGREDYDDDMPAAMHVAFQTWLYPLILSRHLSQRLIILKSWRP
jgi:hypothetical protein